MASTVAPATSSDGDVADTRSVARQLGLGFWLSAAFVVLMVILAVLAPILPIADPTSTAVGGQFEGPRPGLWFGADILGLSLIHI